MGSRDSFPPVFMTSTILVGPLKGSVWHISKSSCVIKPGNARYGGITVIYKQKLTERVTLLLLEPCKCSSDSCLHLTKPDAQDVLTEIVRNTMRWTVILFSNLFSGVAQLAGGWAVQLGQQQMWWQCVSGTQHTRETSPHPCPSLAEETLRSSHCYLATDESWLIHLWASQAAGMYGSLCLLLLFL